MLIKKLKRYQFLKYKRHKQCLRNFNNDCVKNFNQRLNHQNGVDREIGHWKMIDIHQMPNPFNMGDEVDFWCCDDNKLVLLIIRHQPYQQFTIIHPDIKKQTPAYWIAQLPIVPSQIIDDEFLLKILKVFDKDLDKKSTFKSGFGMLKTHLSAKDLDVDVA